MKRIIALGAILLMITAVGCKEENESKVEDNTIKSEERVEKVEEEGHKVEDDMREEFKFDHKEDSSIGDLLLFKSKDYNLYIAKRDKKDFDMLEFKKFFMGLSKEEINENMYMILFEDNTGITLTHNSYTMIMGYGKLPDEYAKELDGLKDYENKVYNIEQDMIYNFEEQIMYIMDENKFGTVRLKEHDSVLAPIVEGEEYIKEE